MLKHEIAVITGHREVHRRYQITGIAVIVADNLRTTMVVCEETLLDARPQIRIETGSVPVVFGTIFYEVTQRFELTPMMRHLDVMIPAEYFTVYVTKKITFGFVSGDGPQLIRIRETGQRVKLGESIACDVDAKESLYHVSILQPLHDHDSVDLTSAIHDLDQ